MFIVWKWINFHLSIINDNLHFFLFSVPILFLFHLIFFLGNLFFHSSPICKWWIELFLYCLCNCSKLNSFFSEALYACVRSKLFCFIVACLIYFILFYFLGLRPWQSLECCLHKYTIHAHIFDWNIKSITLTKLTHTPTHPSTYESIWIIICSLRIE